MDSSRAYIGPGISMSTIWLIVAIAMQLNSWVQELKDGSIISTLLPNGIILIRIRELEQLPAPTISVAWPAGVLLFLIVLQLLEDT